MNKMKVSRIGILCFVFMLVGMCGIGYTLLDKLQEVLTIILLFGCLLLCKTKKVIISKKYGITSISIILLFVLIGMSYSYSISKTLTLNHTIRMFLISIFCLFDFSEQFIQRAIKTLVRGSLIMSISIVFSVISPNIFRAIFGWYFVDMPAVNRMLNQGLAVGLIGHNAYAAGIANICIGFFVSKYYAFGKTTRRDLIIFAIGMLALLTTGKRITLISIAITTVLLLFIKGDSRKRKRIIRFLCMFGILFILMNLVLPEARQMMTRLLWGMGDTTFNNRQVYWTEAMKLFSERKLRGWGFGIFPYYDRNFGTGRGYFAHNQYYEILAELGILGISVLVLLLASNIFSSISNVKRMNASKEPNRVFISTFVLYYQIWFATYGLSATPLYNYSQYFLFVVLSVFAMSLNRGQKGLNNLDVAQQ